MEDKKIKKFTKTGKIALSFTLIGTAMIMIAMVIAALRTDILCGIAVSGFFLAAIGIVISISDSSKKEKEV